MFGFELNDSQRAIVLERLKCCQTDRAPEGEGVAPAEARRSPKESADPLALVLSPT